METLYKVGDEVLIKARINSININSSSTIVYNLTGVSSSVKEADIVSVANDVGAGGDGDTDDSGL